MAVQEEFFGLIDCIVTTLNYVPVKEISNSTVIMKSCNIAATTMLILKTFIRLVEYHKIFKEVLRDLGILELCVNQLHGYTYVLQKECLPDNDSKQNEQDQLGLIIIYFLTILVNGAPKNVDLFRKVGGTGCLYGLVNFENCQSQSLELVKVLTLSSGSEDDMNNFTGLIRSALPQKFKIEDQVSGHITRYLKRVPSVSFNIPQGSRFRSFSGGTRSIAGLLFNKCQGSMGCSQEI